MSRRKITKRNTPNLGLPSREEMVKIILAQEQEIKQLRRKTREIGRKEEKDDEEEDGMEDSDDEWHNNMTSDELYDLEMEDSEHSESAVEDSKEEPLPKPIADDVQRCIWCQWEVVEGFCQNCGFEHAYTLGDDDEDDYAHIHSSISTDHDQLRSERQLAPRGTTPLDTNPTTFVGMSDLYAEGRQDEFRALIARGATREMCEAFNLQYVPEQGIIAWADEALFQDFSGPAMKPGQLWKIYLGRRIKLEDGDEDGSQFIEEFLEDATMYRTVEPSPDSEEPGRWETILDHSEVWITRPVVGPRDAYGTAEVQFTSWDDAADDENGPIVNKYEDSECDPEDMLEEEEITPSWYYDKQGMSSPGNPANTDEGGEVDMDMDEESSVDSDFDSQESLSGDEHVLQLGHMDTERV
ncbi:hypothetical protein EVG20_g3763 [Dentipellis fragilis]|uniref:DUF8191 domain-containing protein n=1 Tax=Dentipellis fragilis TaxID=205917 RepID=A0A4Y9Z1Z5_9AGAM|nr:hypothetical protein EVG20_g3763 [Dentipellis fragilis]